MADSDILKGAELMAAARTLGLSEDETINLIQRKNAQNNRRRGTRTSDSTAGSALSAKLAQVAALNAEMPADIDGYSTVANDVIEYGDNYNTDTSQQFGGINKDGRIANVDQSLSERAMAAGKRDPNVFFTKDRQGNIVHEEYVPDGQPTPARFRESEMRRDFGLSADNNTAPAQSVMLDAKARLDAAIAAQGAESLPGVRDPQRGIGPDITGSIPYDARTPSALDAIGQLEDSIYGTSAAEQSLAREMVRRDANNTDPEVVEANNWRAQAEARQIAHTSSGSGPVFDQMGNITKIGHAKVADDFNVNMRVPGRETEPNSLPITTAETLNSPVTDNRYAGPLQRQEQWLADRYNGLPDPSMAGAYPQVSIDQELNNLSQGLGKIRIGGQGIDLGLTRVRGLDDLQAAVDAVITLSAAQGKGFTRFEDGKNVTATNPGITEVLQKAGYNQNKTDGLARALFAIEAGRRSPVNQTKKELFAEGISGTNRPVEGGGTHESLGGGAVGIARAGRQKTGSGREVTAALQALQGDPRADTPLTATELADARRPYVGAAEGDKPRKAYFLSEADAPLTPDQRVAKHGELKGGIANQVEKREREARAAKEASLVPRSDPTSAAFRARDAEFAALGERRRAEGSERALAQLRGSNVTNAPDGFSAPKADPVMAQKLAVNQEPLSGISYNENAPDPWTTPPATGDGISQEVQRRVPDSMLNELAELNSGAEQGPRRAARQGPTQGPKRDRSFSERAAYAANKIKGFGTSPRYQRGRRISYGAGAAGAGITGLSALIGGESERRQEEQYQ